MKIKKLLSAFLSTLMIVSAFVGVISFSASAASDVKYDVSTFTFNKTGTTSKYDFRVNPAVYEVGDGYNVIWVTTFTGTGYIKYTYEGKEYTVYDEDHGVICTNEDIHTVKVPHEHLANNTYTVYSQVVTANNASGVSYGTTISSGEIPFKGYDGSGTVNVLQYTDTHDGHTSTQAVAAQHKSKDVDLLVFTGDIANDLPDRKDIIDDLFKLMANASGGRFPVVYCRGNHETRGRYGAMLLEYFETATGKFYFDFTYGPLYGLVLDTGEDKGDSAADYGGLADYKNYIAEQKAWLCSITPNKDAAYRLAIYHIPRLNNLAGGTGNLSTAMNALGFHIGICGHDHTNRFDVKGSNGLNFPQVVLGQSAGGLYEFTEKSIEYLATGKSGEKKASKTFALESTFAKAPNAPRVTYGLNQRSETRAGGTNYVIAEPTVFETGDNYYTIVWATSDKHVGGAYVEYTYKGKLYQVYDESGGFVRTTDTVHSVQVPKVHLNNNTYRAVSFHMRSQSGYTFARGSVAVSKDYLFENKSTDADLTILNCPEIMSTSDGALDKLSAAVAALGSSPALVVVNGDSVDQIADMAGIYDVLKATHAASGGTHPVVFTRGTSELTGNLSSRLGFYMQNSTGEFFYKFSTTHYDFIVLDDAALCKNCSASRDTVLVDLIRERQLKWLEGITLSEDKKTVVISHCSALDGEFAAILKQKGAPMVISACGGDFAVNADSGMMNVLSGGFKNGVSTVSSITLSGDNVAVKAANSEGAVIYSESLSIADLPKDITSTPDTDAPGTGAPGTADATDGGCGSAMAIAIIPAALALASVCAKKKKKEN